MSGTPDAPDAGAASRRTVHRVLVTGLGLSAALMVVGLACKLVAGDHVDATAQFGSAGPAASLGDRLMTVGVVVLAATPAIRVVMLVWWWARERDWRFVLVAVAVIASLALGVAAGGH